MFAKVAFVAFALFVAGARSRPHEAGSESCAGKPDGVYGDALDNRGYYVCLEEQEMVRMRCDEGKHFNPASKGCISDDVSDEVTEEEEAKKNLSEEKDEEYESLKSELIEVIRRAENGTDDDDDGNKPRGISKYKVYNIVVSENIFPESLVVIGKRNHEQKNA